MTVTAGGRSNRNQLLFPADAATGRPGWGFNSTAVPQLV